MQWVALAYIIGGLIRMMTHYTLLQECLVKARESFPSDYARAKYTLVKGWIIMPFNWGYTHHYHYFALSSPPAKIRVKMVRNCIHRLHRELQNRGNTNSAILPYPRE